MQQLTKKDVRESKRFAKQLCHKYFDDLLGANQVEKVLRWRKERESTLSAEIAELIKLDEFQGAINSFEVNVRTDTDEFALIFGETI